MAVDVDVVVERDAALAPFGVDVRLDRQGGERRAVQLLEQLAAADAEMPHRPAIELVEQHPDRRVELGEREEPMVAQAGQDPALDDLDGDLDLGLVARPARPGRQDRRAVVRGEVLVGPVQPGLVPVGPGHPDLGVVGHDLARHAADEGQRPGVRADPVGQRLRQRRLGIGVARRAQHRDEHLRGAQLAGAAVGQVDRLAGVVDEQPLARRMHLAHGRRQPALPLVVELAEPRVAVALGLLARYSCHSSIKVTPGRRSSA